MLALIYLGLAICVGDRLCGRFYRFISTAHRWATATLVGLLLSSCFSYLAARHFASASNPLIWGDILFVAVAATFLLTCPPKRDGLMIETPVARSAEWDWITLGIFGALACWMMFATLDLKNGNLLIGTNQWSDYGPNTAIVQNFAFGHNFPAEYPHFANEPIRYHFLFYFLAGNLEFLGLNLAWSLNIISILTMVCMLAVVMALGELLFKSRAVGVLAAVFFFFHGTLNLVPFLRSQPSFKAALLAAYKLMSYLSSGYPYRGEDWGIWTQVVFVNQRHFASSIGIFLVVLFFLFDRYLEAAKQRKLDRALAAGPARIPPQATTETPITAGIPAWHEDGEHATDATSMDEAQTSAELQPTEQWQPTPEPSSIGEAQPSGALESLDESAQATNASAGEAETSDTRAYDEQSRAEPETSSVSEIRTLESLDESAQATHPSAGEAEMSNTRAYDEQSRAEPETSFISETEPSRTLESLEGSAPAANYASAGESESSGTVAYGKGSGPEPETGFVREAEPSSTVESLEGSSQSASHASAGEAPTFATGAYNEYIGLETDSASAREAEESEALEFVKQSSHEHDTSLVSRSVSETQSPQATVPEPVPKVSRGIIAQFVHDNLVHGRGFIFSGLLLGALPYWNAPVFTASAAVLACLFVLFPCRRYMVGLALTAAVVGLPQVLALRSGNARSGASLIHWGYTLGAVPVSQVLKYLWWTFGLKWVLILVALLFFSWRNLRLFLAIFSLFLLTFCVQFSDEGLANHKFLNIWLVVANLFVAYGLWRLWHIRIKGLGSIPVGCPCSGDSYHRRGTHRFLSPS